MASKSSTDNQVRAGPAVPTTRLDIDFNRLQSTSKPLGVVREYDSIKRKFVVELPGERNVAFRPGNVRWPDLRIRHYHGDEDSEEENETSAGTKENEKVGSNTYKYHYHHVHRFRPAL